MVYEKDFFRDTGVRYLGYANEVGEAFRPVIPRKLVLLSYKVAGGYVLADTAHKSLRTLWREGSLFGMLAGTGDALIWQGLASIVIPGFTINRIVYYSGRAIKGRPIPAAIERFPAAAKFVPVALRYAPVALGLACIPIIVTPIDRAVDGFMNVTYRIVYYSGRAIPAAIGRFPAAAKFAPVALRYAPVALGLACIPIIVTPIDRAVDGFMNVTY